MLCRYTPTQEEECEEKFKKVCSIEMEKEPSQEIVEVLSDKRKSPICIPPPPGLLVRAGVRLRGGGRGGVQDGVQDGVHHQAEDPAGGGGRGGVSQ